MIALPFLPPGNQGVTAAAPPLPPLPLHPLLPHLPNLLWRTLPTGDMHRIRFGFVMLCHPLSPQGLVQPLLRLYLPLPRWATAWLCGV